jgi:uncharacterized protein
LPDICDTSPIQYLYQMRRQNCSMDSEENKLLPLIVERLKTIHPYKIILFGSYAYGVPDVDSDIDLLVVLNSETMPKNFQENMENKLLVRNALQELNKRVAIDLIVHTRPMYKKFNDMGSMFSRELLERGKVLYEASNA